MSLAETLLAMADTMDLMNRDPERPISERIRKPYSPIKGCRKKRDRAKLSRRRMVKASRRKNR